MSKTKCTCRHCGKEYEAPIQSDHRVLCGDSASAKGWIDDGAALR